MLRNAGFSLLEALIASAVAGFVAMGIVTSMGLAVQTSATAQDVTELTALAIDRQEFLNSLPFSDPRLAAGGSLRENVTGYSMSARDDGSAYVRWQVVDESFSLKRIRVAAGLTNAIVGGQREVMFETYRILSQ